MPSDVRHEEDMRSLVDKTVERFGRLDVAVNNAGTEGVPGPVTEQTAESYSATFDTNVLGTLLSMKHELRAMLAQGRGSIVNVSSTSVTRVRPALQFMQRASMQWKALRVGSPRSGRYWRACQRSRPRSDRDPDAEPLRRDGGKKDEFTIEGAAQTRRSTRRDCSGHRLYLFRQGVVHHGCVLSRRRR